MKRFLGPAAGAVLVALSLWIVGIDDRVVDAQGATLHGRIVKSSGDVIVLDTAEGRRTFDPGRISVRVGLLTSFRPLSDRPDFMLAGLLAHLLAVVTVHLRWGVLLDAAGFPTTLLSVLRLGWIGQFFASVLPGGIATGDVVKALYAGEPQGRRAHAATTVVLDRLLGLIVLCTIALLGALLAPGSTRVGGSRAILAVLLGGGLLLLAVLLSPRLRAKAGLTRLVPRRFESIPAAAGKALALYAGRGRWIRGAACVAVASQALVLFALYLYGCALGVQMSLFAVVAAIPVAQMLSAVPGLPGGFGFGDLAFVALLPDAGVPAGTALALSLTYKALHVLIALPAGLWLRRYRP